MDGEGARTRCEWQSLSKAARGHFTRTSPQGIKLPTNLELPSLLRTWCRALVRLCLQGLRPRENDHSFDHSMRNDLGPKTSSRGSSSGATDSRTLRSSARLEDGETSKFSGQLITG